MSIDRLLARPGLDPTLRLLAVSLVAIWRADWATLREAARAGAGRGLARADFEEMLLQAVLFCGFPRVVTAFEEFTAEWPATAPPAGGAVPPERQGAAGRELFDAIYGRNAEMVRALLGSFHADLRGFVLEVAYGRILARPGLSGRVRELLAIAALAASDQRRQYAGHARGALHLGATREELREVLATVFEDDAEVGAWLQRVPPPDG
jgi:alkylhydroperoxidase/carboxymuconolactone decarboxylase family protein YurZ